MSYGRGTAVERREVSSTVSIRETIERLLSRGDAQQDPDELIELAVVPLATGPMIVDALRADGLNAGGAPTYNVATGVASDYRVLVPRRQAEEAARRLERLQ